MLGEAVRNCVNRLCSGVFTPNGENDREHRLFTNKGSFSLLFDVYTFPGATGRRRIAAAAGGAEILRGCGIKSARI